MRPMSTFFNIQLSNARHPAKRKVKKLKNFIVNGKNIYYSIYVQTLFNMRGTGQRMLGNIQMDLRTHDFVAGNSSRLWDAV